MVSSHTASLAGSREVWESMCRQTGAVNTFSLEEFLDMLVAFHFMPPAKGLHVLVGGGAGGRSVLSADECEEEGLRLMPIPPDVRADLARLDPFFGPWVNNPVDGSIMGGSNLNAAEVLELIARSPSYDVVINNIGAGGDPRMQRRVLSMIAHTQEIATKVGKPVALVMSDVTPGNERQLQATQELRQRCIEAGFAIFPSIGRASRATRKLVEYHRHRDGMEDGPGPR
jgi:acyl-CoA synthetase (NDP forming)